MIPYWTLTYNARREKWLEKHPPQKKKVDNAPSPETESLPYLIALLAPAAIGTALGGPIGMGVGLIVGGAAAGLIKKGSK
jgi:hypothetical protein